MRTDGITVTRQRGKGLFEPKVLTVVIESLIILTFMALLLRLILRRWNYPGVYFIMWFRAFLVIFAMIKWLWPAP